MKKMIILINGLSGTGKSVLCERLAKEYGLEYYPTSSLLRQLKGKEFSEVNKADLSKNDGWWEGEEGKKFIEEREKDKSFDRKLDEELLKLIAKGNIVLDSWTMPWLSKDGFKVWLSADEGVRFKRVMKRDGSESGELVKTVRGKEEKTKRIFSELYGIKYGEDLSPYHFILDTTSLNEEQVFDSVKKKVDEFYKIKN
ncbi:MAG: cytidylate kinase family protein [Candidatus Diapherotrites archaeon]